MLSGVAVDLANLPSALILIETLSSSLESLHLVQVGRLIPPKSHRTFLRRTITLPKLQDLVLGSRSWKKEWRDALERTLDSTFELPSLRKFSLGSLREDLDAFRWGVDVLRFIDTTASIGQLRSVLPTADMDNVVLDHSMGLGASGVQELVIRLTSSAHLSPSTESTPTTSVASIKRIIIIPVPEYGRFDSTSAEGMALRSYVSKDLFPGLEEVIWIETTPYVLDDGLEAVSFEAFPSYQVLPY